MVAVMTYSLDQVQIRYMKISGGVDEELMLSQRLGFYTHELVTADNDAQRHVWLQALSHTVMRMEELQLQLHSLSMQEPENIGGYDERKFQEYLKHAKALLLLPVSETTMNQPDVDAVLQASHSEITQNLEALSQYYNKKIDTHLMELSYVVFVLTGFVMFMLMVLATIVLRPAIAYVSQAQSLTSSKVIFLLI